MAEKYSYGLDLAGYSSGKSTLARAEWVNDGFKIIIYRSHPFSKKLEGRDLIAQQFEYERQFINALLDPIYIDVPIDLQGLPTPLNYNFVWELTKRPVDFAFNALPPLADRIGSPVSRMKNALGDNIQNILGTRIFETYPKVSLDNMLNEVQPYKGKTSTFLGREWVGEGGLTPILQQLAVTSEEGTQLNDDHVDAMICSLTGVVPEDWLLQGVQLLNAIRQSLAGKVRAEHLHYLVPTVPNGYVVIGNFSTSTIHITFENEWKKS